MEYYIKSDDVQKVLSDKYKELTNIREECTIPVLKVTLESQSRLILQMKAQMMLLDYNIIEEGNNNE